MATGEFYKMEYDAWDEGTVDLTLEEEAAYLRICHQIYRRKQPMPQSAKLLCALWRCHPNKAKKLLHALLEKGKIHLTAEGQLANNRVGRELDARELKASRLAVAGRLGGTQSGVVRGNQLKLLDPPEAPASAQRTREEEIRGEERREKDGAGAPSDPPDKAYFIRARQVLGPKAGGSMGAKILKVYEGSIPQATILIERASEKADPMSYINKALNNMHDPTRGLHGRF